MYAPPLIPFVYAMHHTILVMAISCEAQERGEHRPIEWGRRVCGGLSSALGVARCGRSAGCVLCVLWGVSAVVCVGGGYPVGVSISSPARTKQNTTRHGGTFACETSVSCAGGGGDVSNGLQCGVEYMR